MEESKLIDGKYEYFAFISYKEEDAKWAKWLQRKLEHYKLPTALRKQSPELPERIRPIYEYKSEAGGGRLKEVIWNGLTSSKYLIVICSPRATKSEWLNNGIRYFVESGQEENIIPFIIEGSPKADNPDEECFPSELLNLTGDRELRGININEMGRDAAAVKVVSRMFDVKFDTLWQRYEREQRKQRRRKISSILGGVSILALASIIFALIVSGKNTLLEQANNEITKERDRANAERDKAEKANISLSLVKDSIQITNTLLEMTNVSLAQANADLNERNLQLKEERNRVIEANLSLTRSKTRAIASEANRLIEEGNIDMAIRILLNVVPDFTSGYDWPYVPEAESALRRATDSLQANHWHSECVLEHSLEIKAAKFSPNGDYVLTASNDNTAKIWNAKSGNLVFAPIVHSRLVNCATFSPDGQNFATGCRDGRTRIFETSTGKLIKEFEVKGNVWSLAYSPKGDYLVCSSNGGLTFYSISEGEVIAKLGRQSTVSNSSFSLDGSKFAWNIGPYAMVVNTDKMISEIYPKLLSSINNDTEESFFRYLQTSTDFQAKLDSTKQCKYSSINIDGSRMGVVTWDSLSYMWNTKDGRLLQFSDRTLFSCFSPDGRYWATATTDGKAHIYDANNGIEKELEIIHDDAILSCNFSSDGKLFVTTSLDKTARIWNVDNNWALEGILQHERPVISAEFNREGTSLVSIQNNNIARVWSVPNPLNHQIRFLLSNAYPTMATFNSNSNKLLYSSLDRSISEWNILDGTLNFQSNYYRSMVVSAEYSHNGKLIVAAFDDGTVHILDENGKDKGLSMKHKDFLKSAHFSPDDRYIITASADSTAIIWNVSNGARISSIMEHTDRVINALFIDDKRILTATADSLYIRLVSSGKIISKTQMGNGSIQYVALSPNCKIIAACDDNNQIYIWQDLNIIQKPLKYAHGGLQLGNFTELYLDMQREVEQSDTTWLKSSISGSVLAEELYRLLSHKSTVNSLSFTSDSKYLISDSENSIKVWDVSTGTLIADNMRHPWRIQKSNISPNGEMMVSIFNDNDNSFLTVWKYTPFDQLITLLKSRFTSWRLTEEEQYNYYLK